MTFLDRMVGLIAPHTCLVCGREGALVCAWCHEEACPRLPERCYRCLAASDDSRVCPKCRRQSRLSHVWIGTDYDEVAKQLVHKLKFERAPAAATVIAAYLHESLPYVPPNTLVTHVPTATSRVRQRGYDQAALIARALAAQTDRLHLTLLARHGQTRQVGASRTSRLEQLSQAFRPLRLELLHRAHILLVDDVVTTGGSLEAAARCLKRAGATTVDAIVFAQKLRAPA